MSGGSFNYLCYDVDEMMGDLTRMADWCEDDFPEAEQELRELVESLDESRDLIKTVEWVASGDYSPDALE